MTPAGELPSIAVAELAGWLAQGRRLQVLDVRRAKAFAEHPVLIPGAERLLPELVEDWAAHQHGPGTVVAYCVHGHEVSQGAVKVLRAHGFDARFLEGGLHAWQQHGGATLGAEP